jgi:rubredoxin
MPVREGEDVTDRYICTICGHVYDPEKGDPIQNIPPETDFTKLPGSWQCHVCFSGKNLFIKEC